MAIRSQELAPKRRTLAGKADASVVAGSTRSAGTQTMCMSAWTSMPAALGLMTCRLTGCVRGGRETGLERAWLAEEWAWAGGRWCRVRVSATLAGLGKTAGVGREGHRSMHFPQRDQRIEGLRCASPMTGPPPLGPGYETGTRRQWLPGHGPTPVPPRYPKTG